MSSHTGRNDPCPCGSGKKYKHCHLSADEAGARIEVREAGHDAAARSAIVWLTERHRKAYQTAMEEIFERMWPENCERTGLDADAAQVFSINAGEWSLARGAMLVRGERRRIAEYLLSDGGPNLGEGQRRWIGQLAERPLRLCTVTDVRAEDGLTLVDALDAGAAPLVVQERAATRSAQPGMLLGARVMKMSDHLELSGAIYPFAKLRESKALARVSAAQQSGDEPAELAIAQAWLAQYLEPAAFPDLRDAASGEPLLLVTDHYRVLDTAALAHALSAQPDVDGDAQHGWQRSVPSEDEMRRSLAAINPGESADRIEVFYRTQRLADEGRAWFDGVAGAAVQFLTREISDPRSVLAAGEPRETTPSTPALPPEVMADAIEQAMHRIYARWADEPIPALGNRTPRQAIATPAGLERVKGLLREYETSEAQQAARDGRRAISYQFLWDALGIAR